MLLDQAATEALKTGKSTVPKNYALCLFGEFSPRIDKYGG